MAIYTPSQSPAVFTREIDLTNGVPNVPTSTGAFVGNFRWGPVREPLLINNEATLAKTFGNPDTTTSVDFHSAAYYLRYSDDLYVVREIVESNIYSLNAYDSDAVASPAADGPRILNLENFNGQEAALESDGHTIIAKYPGTLGASLLVSICGSDSDGADSDYTNWNYKGYFDGAPGTSSYATGKQASNDEVHVVVIDKAGEFTGTRGSVLETYSYVSLASDAKTTDGSSNYIKDVVNARSSYVWLVGYGTTLTAAYAGTAATTGKNYKFNGPIDISLSNGANSSNLTATDYATGFDLLEDPDTYLLDFLIAPGMSTSEAQVSVVNDLVSIAQSTRKDCMVITSPYRGAVVNNTTPRASTITSISSFTRSSYLVVDNNYLKIYDKYNDGYVYIPAASSTAGIMAATDNNFAPWYSPAGTRRGQYLGITSLAYSANKSDRDELYKAGVNPIANIPGQGVLLYGDKTHLARPSAFDRINVRRLFLVLERAIAAAAQNILFEFNDEFTRAEFVNIIEPLLRDVKGRRGITDFKLVCDETNNTAEIIDTNQFIATLFIKPARSINFITLNFVAVRTGVSFEELVGDNGVTI